MKTPLALSLVLALAFASACAPKVNDAADVQAINQSVETFAKAMNAGDAEGLVSVMTEKTIYADNHFPVVVGKSAVKQMYDAQFGMFTAAFQAPVDEVRVVGDLAVSRGTWTITLTPKAAGPAPITDGGSWMAISSRQPDGTWKWDSLVPNSNRPMPGATSDGADEQALMQIERDWAVASAANDAAAIDKLMAAEYVGNTDGRITPKKQALADVKSGASKTSSAEASDLRVFVAGDTASVHGVWTETSTLNGKDMSGQYRFIDTFIKRDGRWQAVATFSTKIK